MTETVSTGQGFLLSSHTEPTAGLRSGLRKRVIIKSPTSTGLGLDQLSPSYIPHPTHGAHLWRQRSLLSREKEGEVPSGHCHSVYQLWDPGRVPLLSFSFLILKNAAIIPRLWKRRVLYKWDVLFLWPILILQFWLRSKQKL